MTWKIIDANIAVIYWNVGFIILNTLFPKIVNITTISIWFFGMFIVWAIVFKKTRGINEL